MRGIRSLHKQEENLHGKQADANVLPAPIDFTGFIPPAYPRNDCNVVANRKMNTTFPLRC